jgi:hypothetical protein
LPVINGSSPNKYKSPCGAEEVWKKRDNPQGREN